jgi:hypothetical protein
MEIRTEITINAKPEQVWKVLTSFEQYAKWNPFVVAIEGKVEEQKVIKVKLQAPGKKAMIFKLRVLVFKKNEHFKWRGNLFIPGLFDGEHNFEIHALENGKSRFLHYERFSGILVPLLRKDLETNVLAGFNAMNKALKEKAEATCSTD